MKKIMFNDRYGLTEAVLQGMKTVTRRAGGKIRGLEDAIRCGFTRFDYKTTGNLWLHNDKENGFLEYAAPYKIGEIVAVAQSYKDAYNPPLLDENGNHYVMGNMRKGWNDKRCVCADLMPHQIRILDVRAERLQDITEEDCLREGICAILPYKGFTGECPAVSGVKTTETYIRLGITYREAFATLINKISGRGTWETNPYVWRIEFELVK